MDKVEELLFDKLQDALRAYLWHTVGRSTFNPDGDEYRFPDSVQAVNDLIALLVARGTGRYVGDRRIDALIAVMEGL